MFHSKAVKHLAVSFISLFGTNTQNQPSLPLFLTTKKKTTEAEQPATEETKKPLKHLR